LQVRTHTELAALARFPGHPYLPLFGDFTERDITEALRGKQVRELSLSCERLTDVRFLTRFRPLDRLALIEGPATLTDLSPVAELAVAELLLRQLPGVRDYRCLNALTELRHLYVGDGMVCRDLGSLPTEAPLECHRPLGAPGRWAGTRLPAPDRHGRRATATAARRAADPGRHARADRAAVQCASPARTRRRRHRAAPGRHAPAHRDRGRAGP